MDIYQNISFLFILSFLNLSKVCNWIVNKLGKEALIEILLLQLRNRFYSFLDYIFLFLILNQKKDGENSVLLNNIVTLLGNGIHFSGTKNADNNYFWPNTKTKL